MIRGFSSLVIAGLCVLGLIAAALAAVFISLPDVTQMKRCMTTELYHVRLCETDPTFVPLAQISPYVIGAVMMSEDASFYSHHGVDLNEMKESLIKDVQEMRYARGASTLTQQLAKNVFLSKDKNLLRKGEEIYLALEIEKHFSKGKILTYYLNVVEFGPNIYGIKKATQYYFGKAPADVNPEEAAFLAFLLPNPKKYHQSFAKKKLTPFAGKMVKTILHRMNISHRISDAEYQASITRMENLWGVPAGLQPATDLPRPAEESSSEVIENELLRENVRGAPQPKPVHEPTYDMTDTPTGEAQPADDESNQDSNDFKYDFQPE